MTIAPHTPPPRDAKASEVFAGFAQDKKRTGKLPVAIGILLGVLLLGYVGLAAAVAGSVPKGATFAGVPVGGMTPDKAIKKLDTDLGPKLKNPFPVTLGAKTANLNPATAGLQPDFSASVHQVADFSLNPVKIFAHLAGAGALELTYKIDQTALDQAVSAAAADLKTPPTEANFLCQDGKLVPVKPAPGMDLKVGEATQEIAKKWWKQGKALKVPGKSTTPKTTEAQLKAAEDSTAKTLLSGPITANIGEQKLTIPEGAICQTATWKLEGEKLTPKLDGGKLRDFALANLSGLETAPVSARFSFETGAPTVVASTNGTKLDPEEISSKVTAGAVSGENREVTVDLTPIPPEFSTEDANAAGIKEVIGEFATPLTSNAVRTGNLRKAAGILTGVLVKPGEQFSLEESLGEISVENGWAASGVIENGVHTTALGGGLSQMCVTALNAAWFAGMDLVEFHPHSVWFSRYPMGRECTLWTGSLDLKWKNPNPNPVVLQGWVSGGQLHMRVWGTKYYEVKTSQSPKSAIRQPTVKVNNWAECVPSGAGQIGFTISNTRTRLLNGKEVDSKTYTHTYEPDHQIVCAKDLAAQKAAEEQAAQAQAVQEQQD